MVLVVSNLIPVAKGWEEDFERRWKQRKWSIAQSPGFIRTEVLRPMKGDHYVVMTYWRSKEDFERWTESQAFMEAHGTRRRKRRSRVLASWKSTRSSLKAQLLARASVSPNLFLTVIQHRS